MCYREVSYVSNRFRASVPSDVLGLRASRCDTGREPDVRACAHIAHAAPAITLVSMTQLGVWGKDSHTNEYDAMIDKAPTLVHSRAVVLNATKRHRILTSKRVLFVHLFSDLEIFIR